MGQRRRSLDLSVAGTSFIGNRAVDRDGIYNLPPGSATISNSTISGNGAAVTGGQGGGLFNDASGTATLASITIDANSASFAGGDGATSTTRWGCAWGAERTGSG